MKPVNWGVLGVSGHYRKRVHYPLTNLPEVKVVAIASRSLEKAKEAASRFGIPKSYGDYESLLRDPEVEAVYIPLPNHLHKEWVKKAADYGKHVLCEKPFSMSAESTEDAIKYAQNRGVLVMEGFMYKLHPKWRYVRTLIDEGEIGQIRAVHTCFAYNLKDETNIRNRLETGGGALLDIGCYAVSSARFITGLEPVRVLSLLFRDPLFGTDTLSSGVLDFGPGGIRAMFTVGTSIFPDQKVEIFGTEGKIVIENPFNIYPDVPGEIGITNQIGPRTVRTEVADQYALEFGEFSRAIRGEGPVPIEPKDAVANQKVLDALFLSEKTENWVRI